MQQQQQPSESAYGDISSIPTFQPGFVFPSFSPEQQSAMAKKHKLMRNTYLLCEYVLEYFPEDLQTFELVETLELTKQTPRVGLPKLQEMTEQYLNGKFLSKKGYQKIISCFTEIRLFLDSHVDDDYE